MQQVYIRHDGLFRPAEVRHLAKEKKDETFIEQWQDSLATFKAKLPADHACFDALDLARIAIEKWRSRRTSEYYAVSLQEMKERIAVNNKEEIPGIVGLEYSGLPGILLSVCHFHRTWSNGLYLDFLATHPAFINPVLTGAPNIGMIGLGTLYYLAGIAKELDCTYIWGETTPLSFTFYEKVFDLQEVKDHIQIDKARYLRFMDGMDSKIGANEHK